MIVFTIPEGDIDNLTFMQDLYERYSRLMYATVLRSIPGCQDCEDIVQDAVTSLCEKVDTLKKVPGPALPAYITYTVKNTAVNYLRHQAVVRRHTADVVVEYLEDRESPEPSPQDWAELRERLDGLSLVWSRLPEDDQELLYRKYVLDQNNQELAEVFHCRPDSVRMRLYRARRRAVVLMRGGVACDKA